MNGENFARYLDSQYKDYRDDLPLWADLSRQRQGDVLELGCGTGRVLEALASRGVSVTGIDNDPAMLARAKNNLLPTFESQVNLVLADISSFQLEARFSLVLALCNVAAQFPITQLRQVFERSLAHLEHGGSLALDLPNPDTAIEYSATADPELVATFIESDSQNPVQVYAAVRPTTPDQYHVLWYYDELLPDGNVKRLEVPLTYHLHVPGVIQHALEQTGFRSVRFRGEYAATPLLGSSSRLIVEATAP